MPSSNQGSVRLFRFSGIDVFLHWSWFVVAVYEIQQRAGRYSSIKWNIIEYLGLFLIVLLHEFGHALACRQVGGTANRIVLWPLGGVAYVDPPPRPGAMLWSIAAGPLVNVLLVPVIVGLGYFIRHADLYHTDLGNLLRTILVIDIVLFVFNVLPVYPLDGGKILWSLLWFIFGRARSLMCDSPWLRRRHWLYRTRILVSRRVAGRGGCLYAAELLGRIEASTRASKNRQDTAPRRLCVPQMQFQASIGSFLEVQ